MKLETIRVQAEPGTRPHLSDTGSGGSARSRPSMPGLTFRGIRSSRHFAKMSTPGTVRPAGCRLRSFCRPGGVGRVACVALMALLLQHHAKAQPSWHRVGHIAPQTDGAVRLELSGAAGSLFLAYFDLYPLEASTDLVAWTPLATVVRTNKTTNAPVYLDTNAPSYRQRFFRTPTNNFFTALAKPSGPHSVGRTLRVLTDPSRTNRYGISTNRSFVLTIWYPAEATVGVLPAAYIDPELAMPLAEAHVGSPGDNSTRLAAFRAFAAPDVPVSPAATQYPLVIYSHGYSFHRHENTEKLEELASHGYIALAMDHTDCRTTVYPSGLALRGDFSDNPSGSELAASVAGRLADDQFVLEKGDGVASK